MIVQNSKESSLHPKRFKPGGLLPGLKRWHRFTPYLYITPALLIISIVFFYPMVDLIRLSRFRVITYNQMVFTGWMNYASLFRDPFFKQAILGNVKLFATVPIMVVLSVLFACLLYEQIKFWKIYRALVFLPYVLAIPVVSIAWRHMLSLDGVVNTALRNIGLAWLALDWIGSPRIAMLTVAGVIIWKELGFGIILLLARLLSSPFEVIEAARLEGANWLQQVWHIHMPELRGVIEFYFVLELITMLSWVFSYVYSMTGGGPANSTQVLEFYIYRKSFGFGAGGGRALGLAAAVSVVLLLGVLVFMFLLSFVESRGRNTGE
jgi:ABC-type sugar transport system permease subunit